MKQVTLALEIIRDYSDEHDEEDVEKDVRFFATAADDVISNELAKKMFYSKSFRHINEVCARVQRFTQTSIFSVVNQLFGEENLVLQNILVYAKFPEKYFAGVLKTSMKGLGTNDFLLTLVIIMRCEIDMVLIKHAFELDNLETLRSWIKDDTSGSYKHALYALIGEKRTRR